MEPVLLGVSDGHQDHLAAFGIRGQQVHLRWMALERGSESWYSGFGKLEVGRPAVGLRREAGRHA